MKSPCRPSHPISPPRLSSPPLDALRLGCHVHASGPEAADGMWLGSPKNVRQKSWEILGRHRSMGKNFHHFTPSCNPKIPKNHGNLGEDLRFLRPDAEDLHGNPNIMVIRKKGTTIPLMGEINHENWPWHMEQSQNWDCFADLCCFIIWVGISCSIFFRVANCKPSKWSPKQLSPLKNQERFSCI